MTYENTDYASKRVLRQRLTIEEFGADIVYIKGETNVVADALSRLPMRTSSSEENALLEELFLQRRVFEDEVAFPLDLERIKDLQQDDGQLTRMLARDGRDRFVKKTF